jgi:hypothetical protein
MQKGQTLELSDIRETLDNALSDLSQELDDSVDFPLVQKEFTLTMTSGVASLAAISDLYIGEIETVLHPNIDGAGTSTYLSRLPGGTRADLRQLRNTIYFPYVIEKNTLYASLGQGTWPSPEDVPPDSAAVVAMGPMLYVIGNVPVNYENRLIELGAAIAMGKDSNG